MLQEARDDYLEETGQPNPFTGVKMGEEVDQEDEEEDDEDEEQS